MSQFQISSEQRKHVEAICEFGSISTAADHLFISRQGLSKSIRAIESQLDTSLFTRSKNGMELTPAGEILMKYFLDSERLWKKCQADIHASMSSEPETIRLGLLSMYADYDQKYEILASFADETRFNVEVVDGDHDFLWHKILNGEVNFAISMQPDRRFNLKTVPLMKNDLSIIVGKNNPLAQLSEINFEQDLIDSIILWTSPYKYKIFKPLLDQASIQTELMVHDKNLMMATVSTSNRVFIIPSAYQGAFCTQQTVTKRLINCPFKMTPTFVYRDPLENNALTVAKKVLEAYKKDSLISRIETDSSY